MISGIYKFENKINGKIYIGQSINVRIRIKSHINNYSNSNLKDYNTHFYRGLRKHSVENFNIEVVEYVEVEKLNEREIYWISHYNSYKNGYNSNAGGEKVTENCEEHPNAKLTNIQTLEIKELLKNSFKFQHDIAKMYGISQAVISDINDGSRWGALGEYSYPIRENNNRFGENNSKSILTDKEVEIIRNRYILETGKKIYEDYKDMMSYTSFERALTGRTYSHLPVYSKKLKKWINK